MAQYRPAGLSDEDSDSDDYGFYEKPAKQHYQPPVNNNKKIELDLQDAIINGNLKAVEDLITLQLQNNFNWHLDSGWTPLMHACFHAQDKIVKYLLDNGANPNYHTDTVTPLMAACSNSSANNDTIYNIVSALIDKGAVLNVGDRYGQTALMRAIASGRIAAVEKFLDLNVNMHMRDRQGWTAVFWAVHHNQLEILKLLITRQATLTDVDMSNRTPLDIAESHGYEKIIAILKEHLNIKDEEQSEDDYVRSNVTSWHDFYPGLKSKERPTYANEIPNLLYGMNCESLTPIIMKSGMDLRTFLLLEDEDMRKLGITLPYLRHRLKIGLRNFHKKSFSLNSVSGLYARRSQSYSVLDCLTSLGSHLQQVYIMEATLHYSLREYHKIQNQIKFEPPDSPVLTRMEIVAKKLIANINSIRGEMKNMKQVLNKISKNNPYPANLIKEKTARDVALGYITEAVIIMSLGALIYKGFLHNLLKK